MPTGQVRFSRTCRRLDGHPDKEQYGPHTSLAWCGRVGGDLPLLCSPKQRVLVIPKDEAGVPFSPARARPGAAGSFFTNLERETIGVF